MLTQIEIELRLLSDNVRLFLCTLVQIIKRWKECKIYESKIQLYIVGLYRKKNVLQGLTS